MVPQCFIKNMLRSLIVVHFGGVHAEIRRCRVDFPSGFQETVESLAWVLRLEERAFAAAGSSFEKDIRTRIEPANDANFLQSDAIGLAEDHSATGGENDTADADGLLEDSLLDLPKVRLAVIGEDFGDGTILGLNDEFIRVDETVAGQSGHAPAHGRLAAAHEANQYDVGKHPPTLS